MENDKNHNFLNKKIKKVIFANTKYKIMKKTVIFILVLWAVGVFAQFNQQALPGSKNLYPKKPMKGTEFVNQKNLTGSSISYTGAGYVPGITMLLTFQLVVNRDDDEYLDGVSMTFPVGITPLESGTSNPLAPENGCPGQYINLVTPVSGQSIMWGTNTPSGCGALDVGTYNFVVNVSIDATVSGPQTISYTIYGDGFGDPPHTITGNITIDAAPSLDVAVTGILLNNYYNLNSTIVPQVVVSNVGATDTTVKVALDIFDASSTLIYTDTATGLVPATQQDTFIFSPLTASTLGVFNAVATIIINDDNNSNNTMQKTYEVTVFKYGYAYNAYDPTNNIPEGPVKIEIPTGVITSLSSSSTDFMAGADFMYGQWYACEYSNANNSKIMTIDTTTGAITEIGSSGFGLTGLAFDVKTGFLFGSAYDGSNSLLVKVNPSNGGATLVGTICPGIIIGIACDSAGNLYGINLNDDNLYSINKSTGAGTVIGPLGVNINYAQDIAFDRDKNKLYGVLYASTGALAEINTSTGQATILTTFPQELAGFAIPYSFTLPTTDIAVVGINQIKSNCQLPNNQTIKATLMNNSTSNLSNIPISYSINGGTPVQETISATIPSLGTYEYTFTQPADLSTDGTYNIKVYTSLTGDENLANDTATLTVKNYAAQSIPYSLGFEPTEELERLTIIDENGGSTWNFGNNSTYAHNGSGFAYYFYDASLPGQDWLMTSCIQMQSGKNYKLTFYYRVRLASYPEKMKVYLGNDNTVAAMNTMLVDLGEFTNENYQLGMANFTVPANGEYYVGFFAYSNPDQYAILLDDVSIVDATSIADNNVSNLSIYPNPTQDYAILSGTNDNNVIRIVNTVGQTLQQIKAENNYTIFSVQNLPAGLYYIQILNEHGLQVLPLQVIR